MEQMSYVFALVIFIILLWFSYINLSYFTTKQACKKQDIHLESCFSTSGKYIFNTLLIVYSIISIVSIYFIISHLSKGDIDTASLYLNIVTILSISISFLLQCSIHVGRKCLLIGRIPFDYRNIKRANFVTSKKLEFTCNQKVYHTSLHLVDKHKIKKAIQRSR